jgi:outer membrane protein OmpA-like peptidoglycan-associated protein
MRKSWTIPWILVAVVAVACSSGPPPREIEDARLAIQEAKNANADQLATREYENALAHLKLSENTWSSSKDAAATSHWARISEAEARQAQFIADGRNAQEELARQSERKRVLDIALREAEIAALQARARTEAEKRAAEAEARAAAERRAAEERLAAQEASARERERARADLEARLAADRAAAESAATARSQAERDAATAELEKTRAQLEASQKAADEAKQAADAERQKYEEQRKLQEANAAELARLQAEQRKTQEDLKNTLSQLASVRQEARGLIVTLPGNIYFDVNKSDVKPAMRARLSDIAKALSAVPDQHVLVEGHTDSDGKDDYNLQLSKLRADAVRSLLIAGGVSPDRIESQGYGETRPIAPNTTPDGKAQNRRVEIVIEGSAAAAP